MHSLYKVWCRADVNRNQRSLESVMVKPTLAVTLAEEVRNTYCDLTGKVSFKST